MWQDAGQCCRQSFRCKAHGSQRCFLAATNWLHVMATRKTDGLRQCCTLKIICTQFVTIAEELTDVRCMMADTKSDMFNFVDDKFSCEEDMARRNCIHECILTDEAGQPELESMSDSSEYVPVSICWETRRCKTLAGGIWGSNNAKGFARYRQYVDNYQV